MIKNIKLFVSPKALENGKIVRKKFINCGFNVVDDDKFDLAVAIGGDGSFLKMVKANNFNSDIYYVGINSGHLGFLQEVKLEELDLFINELQHHKYRVDQVDVQETTINHRDGLSMFNSFNEIEIRDSHLKTAFLDVKVNKDFLEHFVGDGLCIATSMGSTGHNLSLGGSIVPPNFSTLQIAPMGAISTTAYRSLSNSFIVPASQEIMISPSGDHKDLLVTIDGENNWYHNVSDIVTGIKDKKIKCLRFSHYNYPQKIYEKLLSK